jgi:hypothetical protein
MWSMNTVLNKNDAVLAQFKLLIWQLFETSGRTKLKLPDTELEC